MRVVTAADMQALEQASESHGVSVDQLMQNAGLAVAQEAWLALGTVEDRAILVLVGNGNNGGDGLVAARHLHDWGAKVACYLLRDRHNDPNLSALQERDVEVCTFDEDSAEAFSELSRLLGQAELVIDALLGTGRSRTIDAGSPLAVVLDQLRAARASHNRPQLVALDLPTGVDADTGNADPHTVEADSTVALGFSKVGLHLLPGAAYTGRVQVVDIGLMSPVGTQLAASAELAASSAPAPSTELMTLRDVRAMLPERPSDANKGTFGKVLVVAGSRNYVGAAYLATSAAMRSGAGLVTLASPESVYPLLASRLAEATFAPQPESADGRFTASTAASVFAALDGYDVMLLGCGIGQDNDTLGFVRDLLFALDPDRIRGVVIDADALNNLAQMPRWWHSLSVPAVLTPHPGEFSRLTGRTVKDIQAHRLQAARDAAAEWRQAVVLKGANTIVAGPSGEAWLSTFANPALASAGTGDVLAGLIAGFLGQGLDPVRAAVAGVYVHGAAGELLAAEMGDSGVLAGDVLNAVPRTMKEIKA